MDNLFFVGEGIPRHIIRASWQSAVLIGIVLLIQRSLRNRLSAHWQAALWSIVLARLLIPTVPASSASLFNLPRFVLRSQNQNDFPNDRFDLFPVRFSTVERTEAVNSNPIPSSPSNRNRPMATTGNLKSVSQGISVRWQLVGGVWLVGLLIVLIRVTAAVVELQSIIRGCRDVNDPIIAGVFARCLTEMRVSQKVRLVVAPGGISPAVTALGRRIWLLLPERMLTSLTPGELRMVFLHELAHVRRADILLQGLWTLAIAVHWFNPVVWFAMFRMQTDRELACDEAVLEAVGSDERIGYGRAILKVVEILSPVTPLIVAVGAFGCESTLKRRITMIGHYRQTSSRWTSLACALVFGFALVGLTDAVGKPIPIPLATREIALANAPQDQTTSSEPSTDKGKLFLNATLKVKDGAGETNEIRGIIEVNPQTGEWRRLVDHGHSPRLSPNGETLVFSDKDKLWNCDAAQALSPGILAEVRGNPSWMPDGKSLVVTSSKSQDDKEIDKDGWRFETWQIRADGGTKSPLPIPASDTVEDISPDGNWFVTVSDRHPPRGRGYQLYVMRSDGTEQRRLTQDGLNCYARFSPDSQQILYLYQKRDANSLKIVNVDGSNERIVASQSGSSNSVGHSAWSPDGKRFAVIRSDWKTNEKGKHFIDNPEDANFRIEILDTDGNNGRLIELKDAKAVWLGASLDWR